jgi:prepilin-type N-terminal cleavage/methylation domain-containing protein
MRRNLRATGRAARAGHTLLELIVVLTVVGITLAIAIPRVRDSLDRISVRSAAGDVRATLRFARTMALAGNRAVAVDIDSVTGTLRVRRGPEVLLTRGVGRAHGVRVGRTRDSLTYDGRGFGRGAANLSVILRRGIASETVFVARLGRVR